MPARPVLLFATDETYVQQVLPGLQLLRFRHQLATEGYTARILRLDTALLMDPESLATELEQAVQDRAGILLTSPLVTYSLSQLKRNLESSATLTVGVGPGSSIAFDYLLLRGMPDGGWADAAVGLGKVMQGNPLPTAVLHAAKDVQADADAMLFSDTYDAGLLEQVPVDSFSERQAESTIGDLARRGVMLVVCPYVPNLEQFVEPSIAFGLRWVVDSAYARLVPPDLLEGTVTDDLFASLSPLLSDQGSEHQEAVGLPLVRRYRSGSKAARN